MRALEECSLQGEDEVGPFLRRQELECGQRRRDAPVADGHSRGEYNAAVRHNVQITGVVRARDPLQRGAFLEAKTGTFFASHSKVRLIVLDVVAAAFHKPAAFLDWVGESSKYAFRCGGIAAFDDERAVDYGSVFP